ncbi:hypothetical protein DYB37_012885 [Aphanomyces astaci]|uniref:Uncharacterized protein n=1 Tax=Aphanomyces astaci TaxID=112090 RepID=A0A418FP88_APHAT|nr:hypothetical protein DYB37_012885 [Aphanomyces astaci]
MPGSTVGPCCRCRGLRQLVLQDPQLVGCQLGRSRLRSSATRWGWQGHVQRRRGSVVPHHHRPQANRLAPHEDHNQANQANRLAVLKNHKHAYPTAGLRNV